VNCAVQSEPKLSPLLCVEAAALPGAPSPEDQAEIARVNDGFDWRDSCLCGINIRKAFKGEGYRVSQSKHDSMGYNIRRKVSQSQ
jgi:hypothetical protein